MRPLPDGGGQREHGNLHHIVNFGEIVDPAQAVGMDDVFGVMSHNDVEARAFLLFGVTGYDPRTIPAVSCILTAVALLATYLPARRATKVEPIVALRYE